MAIPSWTYPSNTNLGLFSERTQVSIPIFVYDTEDKSSLETRVFDNAIDSTLLPTYSNAAFFWIKSTGLPQTAWLGQPDGVNKYTPLAQKYVFKFPREERTITGETTSVVKRKETNTSTTGFFGVAVDGVPFKSPNLGEVANIGGRNYTENTALYPIQSYQDDSSDPWGPFADGSGIIGSDRKFYYQTDPRFLYEKDPTKHSPIIGYAFDGNPIYGPYGYSNGDDPTSDVRIMRTSYRVSEVQRANGTIPDGSYIEDFVYEEGLGDLDEHNHRYCKTPEYPGGVHAYFVTVDPDDSYLPRYPYILGPTFFQEPLLPNGNLDFPGDIALSVISGQLPPGLRIEELNIVGTPFEVPTEKTFRFVLRAKNIDGISDRTYYINIEGADSPVWVTPAGDLQVGAQGERSETVNRLLAQQGNIGSSVIRLTSVRSVLKNSVVTSKLYPNAFASGTTVTSINTTNKTLSLSTPIVSTIPIGNQLTFTSTYSHTNLFVLDGDYVNYQLSAIDQDLSTGQKLSYYIPPRGGELPPGLTLSGDGIISGFTDPILVNDIGEYNGNYDMQLYDKFAYDYGVRPYNGYDSFLFDNTIFDYSDLVRNPRKLNRYYQFRVRVFDGQYYEDRVFRIFVVGDDFFRSDTTLWQAGSGVYTADITPIRKPIWLTPSYLGRRRANNYITTYLDVYDVSTLRGAIGYVLDPVNDDGSLSKLPPGMLLDQISGEIYGDVPYQPAVTKTYKFTVRAIRYDPDTPIYGQEKFTSSINSIGQTTLKLDSILNLRVDSLVTAPQGSGYITPGTIITAIDAGTKTVTLSTPLLKTIPSGERFIFSYVVSSAKTFTIDIIGEIDSTIRFITSGDLGEIAANFTSDLYVEAISTVTNAVLNYTIIGGRLPPGLTLVSDGTIQGKVNQYATEDKPGLTTFDNNDCSFDKFTTSVDRDFTFIVLAQDQFKLSAVTKIFTISVTTPNDLLYSNIFVKPFLKTTKRLELTDFFTNPEIFEYDKIYRPSDPEFGVQTELKMLVYAGIETKNAAEYAAALGRSSKKRYRFGSVKKSVAKTPGTNNVIYEAVYIEIIDNMENSKGSIPVTKRVQLGKDPTRISPDTGSRPLETLVKVNQNKRDIWDSTPQNVYYNKTSANIGETTLTLNSTFNLSSDDLITSAIGTYFQKGTALISINKNTHTITFSKPLIKTIPVNTQLRFDSDQLGRIWMQDKIITADFSGQQVSDINVKNIFGNSTSNIRKNIEKLGETERNFLPLWMRTPQTFSGIEQGFNKAILLCYVKPGYGDRIINNIKNLGIDFKNVDFTVDRVIIDSVKGEVGDKYIAFAAREIING